MLSLRERIENFIYPHIEKYLEIAYEGDSDTELFGIKLFDGNFSEGATVYSAAILYVHYVKTDDPRAKAALKRLNHFISAATNAPCLTWAKLSILRAYAVLSDAGLLDRIDSSYTEAIKVKTDYADFVDKENGVLIKAASNYLQVAMACAGLRVRLGWESDEVFERIKASLYKIVSEHSFDFWTDEEPPYGRFDRYSFILSSEISDNFFLMNKNMPDWAQKNLALAADYALFAANSKGDGFNYGRSLSTHGDSAMIEVLSAALARGLVNEEKRPLAIAYIGAVVEKLLNFWYREDIESFDIWWNGRSTNKYRQVQRVFEVNLDMCLHLYTVLLSLDRAGVADDIPDLSLIPTPDRWIALELNFHSAKSAIFLRRGDTLAMLPLIGCGYRYTSSGYFPYPAICGVIEAAPEAKYPFLTPEYQKDGKCYRPCEFYDDITLENGNEDVTVTAVGRMSEFGDKYPVMSDYSFRTVYTFSGDNISVRFYTDAPMTSARMLIGTHGEGAEIKAYGFDVSEPQSTDSYDFLAPHGKITEAVMVQSLKTSVLGYDVKLI